MAFCDALIGSRAVVGYGGDQCITVLLLPVVGGLGFEFCMFVVGWRYAFRTEWPFFVLIFICMVLPELLNPQLGMESS